MSRGWLAVHRWPSLRRTSASRPVRRRRPRVRGRFRGRRPVKVREGSSRPSNPRRTRRRGTSPGRVKGQASLRPSLGIGHEVHDKLREGGVERVVGERQRLRRGLDDLDPWQSRPAGLLRNGTDVGSAAPATLQRFRRRSTERLRRHPTAAPTSTARIPALHAREADQRRGERGGLPPHEAVSVGVGGHAEDLSTGHRDYEANRPASPSESRPAFRSASGAQGGGSPRWARGCSRGRAGPGSGSAGWCRGCRRPRPPASR